ncbi:aminopeptidase [Dictyobacter kobayashii]|uniref:Aminopeptidase n=1 Tax=Dictyobacter kobayashii TaxID=2014872 RepID=A0A402ABY5_9CHLR|nr:aminopeptidase [Dictyobacter kobayashii]GCE16614.1 aminopeptidase [Dictyobacter kobayashii]
MNDIRIERWAHTLVHYCLYLKPGDILSIQATPLATPLIEAVYREALHVGAHPVPVIELEGLTEILLREGNDSQLTTASPVALALAEKANARLSIQSASNPKALSTVPPARSAKRRQASHAIANMFRQREQAGDFRWCGTLYPTTGYAQEANMSLKEFEEFVFEVCFLNDPDPIARWKELASQQQHYVDWLVGKKQVHVLGEGTDLKLSIADRIFINSDGKRNFPSGEFFTGPIENSANGVVQFDIPATYDGRSVEGVRLVFREGKVVEASARQGNDYLQQMLNLDEGARYLGEFAFGNNKGVTHATKQILFDEKMGGTIHMALGASYPETGGLNRSALHWDMVCDLRTSGEVWIDDTLFLKNGQVLV